MPSNNPPDATKMALKLFKVQEILHNIQNGFNLDFEVSDIPATYLRSVFSQSECDDINRHATELGRIDQLFYFLSLDVEKFKIFIGQTIFERYHWLSDRMRKAFEDTTNDAFLLEKFDKMRSLRLDVPRLADYNVHRKKYSYVVKMKLKGLKRNEYLVLTGNLSYGKKWLALGACVHYEVMERMNFNIFFLDLRDSIDNERILESMKILSEKLGPIDLKHVYGESESTIIAMQQIISKQLDVEKYKDCLLVLVDVQNVDTFKAFLRINSKMLITTRNKELLNYIPEQQTKQVDISNGFEEDESCELFSKVLGTTELPDHWSEIHHLCNGNPLLVWLVANNLKKYNKSTDSLKADKWQHWVKTLQKYESTKHSPFRTVVDQSLKDLHESLRPFFEDFAIFPDNRKIPASMLERYWKKSAHEVENIINDLDALHLVEAIYSSDRFYCSIQYHYCSYLTDTVTEERKLAMHQRLVDSYGIVDALANRTDPNIVSEQLNDKYFYFFIAHHLMMAGRSELMPKLYLDIGFLEQKLRVAGLANTIGDLNAYRDKITCNERNNERFMDELLKFLPNVEEMLKKSEDTSLLQYAISSDGLLQRIGQSQRSDDQNADVLQREALRQASQFKHRLFFIDNDHVYHHRQIMKLKKAPVALRFVKSNIAIIANIDHTIWLNDLSLNYSIEPTQFVGHEARICELHLLLEHYFLTLDTDGVCKLWTYQLTQIQQRRNSRSRLHSSSDDLRRSVRQSRTESFIPKYTSKCLKSMVNSKTKAHKLTCLLIVGATFKAHSFTLYGGTESGQILRAIWNTATGQFDDFSVVISITDIEPIQSIVSLDNSTLMVLSRDGQLSVFMVKTASFHKFPSDMYENSSNIIAVHMFLIGPKSGKCRVLVVFSGGVRMVTLPASISPPIKSNDISTEQMYTTDDNITCCVLSTDSKYLVLGTSRGIVVYDVEKRQVTLRSSVTDVVTCLDIHELNSAKYKYRLMCGAQNHPEYIYLYGVEEADSGIIKWAPDRMGSPIDAEGLLGHNQLGTWLLGGKQFDVSVDPAGDCWRFAAIDSDGALHQYQCKSEKFASPQLIKSIKCIEAARVSMLDGDVLVGCHNGDVFVNDNLEMQLNSGAITYAKLLMTGLWLVSSENSYYIRCGTNSTSGAGSVLKAFLWKASHVIVVKKNMPVEIYNSVNNELTIIFKGEVTLKDADFVDDLLVLSTTKEMRFYHIIDAGQALPGKSFELSDVPESINCIKLSQAKEYVAIGYTNGVIRVHATATMKAVATLRSHQTIVQALLFSPWTSASPVPVILVSVGDELCFWNITWAINNPTEDTEANHHYHGNHHLAIDPMTKSTTSSNSTSSGISCDSSESSETDLACVWVGKRGPSIKPELLSCIKLVGNRAENIIANVAFDTFLTIDDEGEIYFLRHCDVNGALQRIDTANDRAIVAV